MRFARIGLIFTLALVAAPLTADAQQSGKVWRIGFLSNAKSQSRLEAFEQGLRELGYVEGRNILIERRSTEGEVVRLPDLAAELTRLKVDVIVAADPPSTQAAKNATKSIPIVMRTTDDPVETRLVTSLAHPGGNITGLASVTSELSAKRLELLKEAVPGITRVAVLWNSNWPGSVLALKQTQAAARLLGMRLELLEVQRAEEFGHAFRAATSKHADALITLRNGLIVTHQIRVVNLAAESRLPAMYDDREFVEVGGLMSYGPHLADLYRRAAHYVDKILKGAKPSDLPVEQPTKFELLINLKTAKALGLTIPQSVLIRADQVIQ